MADDVKLTFSEIVREVITITGLTQDEIANETGISQPTINKWLNSGVKSPGKAKWDKFVAWACKQPGTAHLFSLDAMVEGRSTQTRIDAAIMLGIFLKDRP